MIDALVADEQASHLPGFIDKVLIDIQLLMHRIGSGND